MTSVSNARWTNYRTSSNPFSRGEDVTRTPAALCTQSDRVTRHSGTLRAGTHRRLTSHTTVPRHGNTTTSSRTAHRDLTRAPRSPFSSIRRTALSIRSSSPVSCRRRLRSEGVEERRATIRVPEEILRVRADVSRLYVILYLTFSIPTRHNGVLVEQSEPRL